MVRLHISEDGDRFWFLNQHFHRANGHAIVWAFGTCVWFWYGQVVTEYEHMMLVAQEQLNG